MKKKYIKIIIITLSCVILQYFFYSIVKSVEGTPILISSAIDSKIPFMVIGIIPYTIWYLLLFSMPLLIYKENEESFVKYIILYLLISISADIIFLIYPTYVIRPVLTNNGILYSLTKIIYSMDTPSVNCMPSLHCAIATLWIIYSIISKKTDWRLKAPIIVTSILIIISTVLIKQHALIDVITGIILTLIVYFILKFIPIKYNKISSILKL